ncbi:YceI family protein [Jannaschia pohangensis]|uniref:Polyisoprenoid-binding protein YceI n=1 Tax=Jannaschia pohangensis TaxID=390807 RepID=A0A1I3NYC6_9RHOB|nr:YceI family protein [Jannaschia pohangensis]SFJ14030.1 Polyisoprenoid-binding protein YceI [Jannaschia pohangensis]
MSRVLPCAALCALIGFPAVAEPHRYELDPAHTTVAFTVQHLGFADTLGLFGEVSGSFVYDMETQELSDVSVTVTSASLNTLNEARDQHVRSGDFLAVDAHPQITFTAQSGEAIDDTSGTVTGDLTILGETRPLTLDVSLVGEGEYPFGHKRFVLGLSARGSLMRSDFGMTYGVDNGLVGDEVELLIEAEAMRME